MEDMFADVDLSQVPSGVLNEYEVPTDVTNQFVVYSITGQEVFRTSLKGGSHRNNIDLSFVQSGMYLYELRIGDERQEIGRISISK
jgi:hypothetical protein